MVVYIFICLQKEYKNMQHQKDFLRRGRCKLATGHKLSSFPVQYLSWKTFALTSLFHVLQKDHLLIFPLVSLKSDTTVKAGHCCLTAETYMDFCLQKKWLAYPKGLMDPDPHPGVRAVTWPQCSAVRAPLIPAGYAALVFRRVQGARVLVVLHFYLKSHDTRCCWFFSKKASF